MCFISWIWMDEIQGIWTKNSTVVIFDIFQVRMRIASDFNEAARDIDNFRESFREGMAAAGGISKDRILARWPRMDAMLGHLMRPWSRWFMVFAKV